MTTLRKPLMMTLAGALAVAGCTTTGPSDPNYKAKSGAIIGAMGGAVAGRMAGGGDKGERNRATLAGAVLGAAAGAAIGNQLDKQEAELRSQLGSQTDIENTGDSLILTMPQDILFATDSSQLRPTLVSDLRTVGQSLLAYPNSSVRVIGHTDNTGEAAYNMTLSQRRASAVANVLMSEGVSSARIQTIGRGEDAPIASNLTAEGRAQNRRVEIIILPNG